MVEGRRLVERYAELAETVLGGAGRLGSVRVVAVDGPAGSGKTTFAGRLAGALGAAGAGASVLHTDDLLDGWTDLRSFWPRLERWVLAPLRRGEAAWYRRYDWVAHRFGSDWQPVGVPDVLVLEGVGSARAAIRDELSHAVFVRARRESRLARGLLRDGESLRAEWLRWMADEDAHFAADGTEQRADLLVDGEPIVPHDPATEYVRILPTGTEITERDGASLRR
jgi:uridine kinase